MNIAIKTWQDVTSFYPECNIALTNGTSTLFVNDFTSPMDRFQVCTNDADGLPLDDIYMGASWADAINAMESAQ